MSLRFKALRSSSNYNKTQFADLMQVAYRTVTNWEKKDLYFENENNPLSNKDNFIFDAVINDYSVSLVLKENKEIAIKTERIKQLEAYSIHYNYYYEFYGEYLLDNHSVLPFRMIFSLFM